MGNKYLTTSIIIVALIVAGGIYYSVSRKSSGPSLTGNSYQAGTKANSNDASSADKNASQNVVSYADSGFSPKSITVKLGDTVVFKNESSRDMWVASAPHPVHTDYPEFDAKKAYAKGEMYSFTFQKAGTWKFHNHMNPTDFGSIVVQ
jgi:plastocyanin